MSQPMPEPYQQDPYRPQPPAPYPPAYQQPQVYTQPQAPTSNWAVVSLSLGIGGLLLGWCLLGIPCLLAIVFGHMALNDMKIKAQSGRGLAITGLVMGYVGVVPAVFVFFALTISNFTT